jgi:KTSC domain
MAMQLTPVESSTLTMIGYDVERAVLRLEFRDRLIYEYYGVPADQHEELRRSLSKGSYFNRTIRGRYAYARVSEQGKISSLS